MLFQNQLRSAQEVIVRLEQEKKTAIQEIMENMQKLVADKNDMKAELILQKDENKAKAVTIENLEKKQETMRKEMEKELREEMLEQAILRQEREMQSIYQKKEDEMKITFADKVKIFNTLIVLIAQFSVTKYLRHNSKRCETNYLYHCCS